MATKRITVGFIFVSVLIIAFALEKAEEKDVYTQAASCPHRFHMGCMLDVVEKCCTGIQAMQKCVEKGKCNGVTELTRIIGALQPDNFEALNKCCCSKAFPEGYENCKNPNPICSKAITDHLSEDDTKKQLKVLKLCRKTKKKEDCKEALAAAKMVMEAVQKARGDMWQAEGCKILAPPLPLTACGWDVRPEPRAIERPDLYCDTIIWQFKEMGASDPFMSQCKDAPKMPIQKEDPGQDSEATDDEGEDEEFGGEDPNRGDEEEMEEEEEGEEPLYMKEGGNDGAEEPQDEGSEQGEEPRGDEKNEKEDEIGTTSSSKDEL